VDGKVHAEDVFRFVTTGISDSGEVLGFLRPTGYAPRCLQRFFEHQLDVPEGMFDELLPVGKLRAEWEANLRLQQERDERETREKIALQRALDLMEEKAAEADQTARRVFSWRWALIETGHGDTLG